MDPRWPSVAADAVALLETDERQINDDRLWLLPDGTAATLKALPAGSCFEAALGDHWGQPYRISRQYREQHQATRGVYVVKLPGSAHQWFSPDWAYGRPDGNPARDGWTVTGTLPLISASPSVNLHGEGGWHGWIGVNGTPPGALSCDLDGRPY